MRIYRGDTAKLIIDKDGNKIYDIRGITFGRNFVLPAHEYKTFTHKLKPFTTSKKIAKQFAYFKASKEKIYTIPVLIIAEAKVKPKHLDKTFFGWEKEVIPIEYYDVVDIIRL